MENSLEGHVAIYTFAPDGSDFTEVITGGANPHWSPDGSQIAYEVLDGARTALRIADADGSTSGSFGVGSSGPWHPGTLEESAGPSPSPSPSTSPRPSPPPGYSTVHLDPSTGSRSTTPPTGRSGRRPSPGPTDAFPSTPRRRRDLRPVAPVTMSTSASAARRPGGRRLALLRQSRTGAGELLALVDGSLRDNGAATGEGSRRRRGGMDRKLRQHLRGRFLPDGRRPTRAATSSYLHVIQERALPARPTSWTSSEDRSRRRPDPVADYRAAEP